jgi:hypothetical protein
MIPKTRLQNKNLFEGFEPLNDMVLIFEPPYESDSNITLPYQKTQILNGGQNWEKAGVFGEIIKFGRNCKKQGMKEGDIVLYPRTVVGTGHTRKRLGSNVNIPTLANRVDNWQEDERKVYSCCLLIKECDIQGVVSIESA